MRSGRIDHGAGGSPGTTSTGDTSVSGSPPADEQRPVHAVRRRVGLGEYWLALRVATWLCWVSTLLRVVPFPELLGRLETRGAARRSPGLERTVSIVARVCRMRVFRLPIFPRNCLRQSLALYRFLRRMGYAVRLQVSVHKDGIDALEAHSWVSLHGRPLADSAPPECFRTLFSFPPRGPWADAAPEVSTQPTLAQRGGDIHE